MSLRDALQYIETILQKETGDDFYGHILMGKGKISIHRRQKMYTNNRAPIVVYILPVSRGRQGLDSILHKTRHGEGVSDYPIESIRERISESSLDTEKYSV